MTKHNASPEDLAHQVLMKIKDAKISYPVPSIEILNKLFKTLFYTSLKTEEDQYIRVTLTFIDPKNPDPSPPMRIVADRWQFVHFESTIPFTVPNLVKLSKAADVWSSSLAVYYNNKNELIIWGMIDQAVHYQSFLNYESDSDSGPEQPGLFQSTITGIGSLVVIFDYELIANLRQDTLTSNYIDVFKRGEVKDIFQKNSSQFKDAIKKYLEKEFPNEQFDIWESYIEYFLKESLSRILLRIQNYQHGGAVLITDNFESDLDVKYSIGYNRLSQAMERVSQLTIANSNYSNEIESEYLDKKEESLPVVLYSDEYISELDNDEAKNGLKGAIRFVASLSCVDGLVLLDHNLNVKGFGTVVKMNKLPEIVYFSKTAKVNLTKLGEVNPNSYGTRHRSMFSYCWNHEGSIGFVISQDGDVRAITKVANKLIMWENIKVQHFFDSLKLKKPLSKFK